MKHVLSTLGFALAVASVVALPAAADTMKSDHAMKGHHMTKNDRMMKGHHAMKGHTMVKGSMKGDRMSGSMKAAPKTP